jgi:hypothetical protein
MSNFCQSCGKALEENAKFCTACGTSVAQETVQQPSVPGAIPTNSFIPKTTQQSSNENPVQTPPPMGNQQGNQPQTTYMINPASNQGQYQPPNVNDNMLNVQSPVNATTKKNNTGLIIAIIAVVLVICVGGIVFAVSNLIKNQGNQVLDNIETYVNDTPSNTDVKADTELGIQHNPLKKDIKVVDIYMSDDMDGYNIASGFPTTSDVIYCQAEIEGITEEAELWITWEDWATGDVLLYYTTNPSEDGFYYFNFDWSDFAPDGFPLGTYEVGIYSGDFSFGGELLGKIAFDMVDPNGGEGELGDWDASGEGFADIELMDISYEEWVELNDWLFYFTDYRLPIIYDAFDFTDQELIDFVVTGKFLDEVGEEVDLLDDGGYYWVSEENVNNIISYYFDIPPIDIPQSTELVVYDPTSNSYGIYGEPLLEWYYVFPQVYEVYDLGDNIYEVIFDVYSAPPWFDGSFYDSIEEWESANEMPEYLGRMYSIYEEVGTAGQKILYSYEWE